MAAAKTGKIMTLWLHTLELELVICTDDFELWLWSQTLSYRNCRDAVNYPTSVFWSSQQYFFSKKNCSGTNFWPQCHCVAVAASFFFFFLWMMQLLLKLQAIYNPVRFKLAFALLDAAIVFSFLVDRCCYCLCYDKFMSTLKELILMPFDKSLYKVVAFQADASVPLVFLSRLIILCIFKLYEYGK